MKFSNTYEKSRHLVIGAFILLGLLAVGARTSRLFAGEPSTHTKAIVSDPRSSIQLENLSLPPGLNTITGIAGQPLLEPLVVRATENGRPLAGKHITFLLASSPSAQTDAALSETTAITDSDGLGSTRFKAGTKKGDYVITAFIGGETSVAPVQFHVEIRNRGWESFLIFGLLGGLGIFLMGMELAGNGLKAAAGDKMRGILSTLTSNRLFGLLVGVLATTVLQSSSASTVMLVGFVSATIMTLTQSLGVILGAKIGTTVTVHLIAFDLSEWSLLLIALGFLLKVTGAKQRIKQTGEILLGFGLIFFGLGIMGDSMKPLRTVREFSEMLLDLGQYPLLGILLATGFTAIVQSSAATIGLAIAFCAGGFLSLEAALPIGWGAHIGTCATAFLSSLGTGREGKQVAVAHFIMSVAGVIIAYPFLSTFVDGARWITEAIGSQSTARALANGHMLFTIITGLIILPFVRQVEWVTRKIMPSLTSEPPFKPKYLEESALGVPVLALDLAHREIIRLFEIVRNMISEAMEMLCHPEQGTVDKMDQEDDKVDILEKAIRPYLARVAQGQLSPRLLAREHAYIYIVQDLEGIGDLLTKELAHSARKLYRHDMAFSDEGILDLREYHENLLRKFDRVFHSFEHLDKQIAKESLQHVFRERILERRLRESHLERLHCEKKETVQTSARHLSVLNNMRAISEKLDDISRTLLEEI